MHTSVLIVHVIAGSTGLVLGPVAMRAVERRGPPTAVGSAYHWSVLAVCVSAVALAAFDPAGLWWFVPIAAGSYAGAAVGRWAVRARPLGWMALHVHGIGGSYIAGHRRGGGQPARLLAGVGPPDRDRSALDQARRRSHPESATTLRRLGARGLRPDAELERRPARPLPRRLGWRP